MVVPNNPTTTQITLTSFTANWTAPTIGSFDNYLLDVSTSPTFATFLSGYNAKNVGTALSETVNALTPGTTYYWRIRANKATTNGQGSFTAIQNAVTLYEPLNLTSTTITNSFDLLTNVGKVVDPNIAVSYSQNISGFRVIISEGLQSGDLLSFNATLPAGITANLFNTTTGVLVFNGSASAATWQTILRSVTFRGFKSGTNSRKITFAAGNLNASSNGHFYEFVASAVSWTSAKSAAAARTYLNNNGYLATITSAAENDYIRQILAADAWIGAADDYTQVNTALGFNMYPNQAASEGKWHWVTGPEAGTQFWNGNAGGSAVSGRYSNWSANEPNNANGLEHLGNIYSSANYPGKWNDVDNGNTGVTGYIVEYGGYASDLLQTPSYTVTMTINTVETGNALNFDGVNDYVQLLTQVTNPTTFTLEAWFKTTVAKGGIVGFNSNMQNSGGAYDRFIWMDTAGKLNFGVYDGTSRILTSPLAYNDGKYHHVAVSFSGATGMKLYVDGALVASNAGYNSVSAYNGYWKIGGMISWGNTAGDYFQGNIDDVRIWNIVRTDSEISANYKKIVLPYSANLVADFTFNQGQRGAFNNIIYNMLYDQTAYSNNASLVNFGLNGNTSNWVESYSKVVATATAATNLYSLGFTANWSSANGIVEKYLLDVSTSPTFATFLPGYQTFDAGTANSHTITGLSNATTYYFRARAEKASVTGTSVYSNVISTTTLGPEGLTALAPTNVSTVGFTANWSAPAINNIAGYTVDVSTASNFATFVTGYNNLAVTLTTLNITGLTAGTTYYYRVKATGYANATFSPVQTKTIGVNLSVSSPYVCSNEGTSVITLTASGSVAPYIFTYSVNGNGAQTITSVNETSSATITVPNTPGTYAYTVSNVTDAIGGSNTGSIFQEVIVYAQPVAGSISGTTNLCAGVASTLTVSGHSGFLQWQSSVNGTSAWTDIFGSNATTLSVSLPAAATHYRVKVFGSEICAPKFTESVTLTLIQPIQYYADADNDGYGNDAAPTTFCGTAPAGFVTNNTDCDDNDALVFQSGVFYRDADQDGFYGGAEISLCYGSTVPAGYLTTITALDCNDNNASVYPGAVEIPNDGIDNDCNGQIDENNGPAITTTLLPSFCGATLAQLNSIIGIKTVNATITKYRIKVVDGASVQIIERNVPNFNLSMLTNFDYGKTYTIMIELQKNSVWTGAYGASCTVSSPSVLLANEAAQINASFCGNTLPTISTLIATTSLPYVTNYRFHVTNITPGASGPNVDQIIERPLHWFSLPMLASFNYNSTYRIEVAIKVNGIFSRYGYPCEVSTPESKLFDCGLTVTTATQLVKAISQNFVTKYRFEVTNNQTNCVEVIERTLQYFNFNAITNYNLAASYTVRVATLTGTWSPYGPACTINAVPTLTKTTELVTNADASRMTSENVGQSESVDFKAAASPNPFTASFGLSISGSQENVGIKIYDMTGRMLLATESTIDTAVQKQLGHNLPAGVYNVIVTQGAEMKTLRVIKR